MTTRGFGDVPDETALKRQGSKRMVNSIAERSFTWILTSTITPQIDGDEKHQGLTFLPSHRWKRNNAEMQLQHYRRGCLSEHYRV